MGWFFNKSKRVEETSEEKKEREKKEEEERIEKEQREKAIQLLEERGITYNPQTNNLYVDYIGTELEEWIPQQIKIKSPNTLVITYKVYEGDNKEINSFEHLIKKIIDNNEDIDNIIKDIYKLIITELEIQRIKKRQNRIKLKQEIEKEYFGKEKSRRQAFKEEDKEMILEKFNNECSICGANEGLHIHHKDKNPENNQINNLTVLCGVCHKKIHMKVR